MPEHTFIQAANMNNHNWEVRMVSVCVGVHVCVYVGKGILCVCVCERG